MPVHARRKEILNRLSRIEGHTHAVKTMVLEGKSCKEILTQIAAVRSALFKVGKILLQDNMDACVLEAARTGKLPEAFQELLTAVERFT
ncbi:MAG: metal-sensitive transcriptional regulator [Candidatus Eremiobacteraeota bacterium]|nr:metal-sensitive transcriptional regulator [Candidatus Eremiobacteraeota bacterium]